ncbi:MAG: PKD domain-containing protein [Saprospiraceae bacterium]
MNRKIPFIGLLLILCCAASPMFSQNCDCVSTGNCPVPIVDNGSFDGTLDVTTLGANDLGTNPLTSVCFSITHTWVGDLNVSLTSPSGVKYLIMADENNNYGGCGQQQDNLDVCIVLGDFKPLTDGTTGYQCNSGPCFSGTCCLRGDWTVPCNVTDPINNTPFAPNCDLNDFNVPGDPVNGTWTLTVTDVCNMDTGVLNNFSLEFAQPASCIVCSAEGGIIDSLAIITCEGDPSLVLDLDIDSTADVLEYGYTFLILENDTIIGMDTLPDLTGLPAGTYEVFGFSYLLADSANLASIIGSNLDTLDAALISTTSPFCADASDNFIAITILPEIPPTIIDTTVCQGDCIMVGGQMVCTSDTLTLDSWHGCDSVVQVTLTTILPDTVELALTVCQGGCTMVGGQSYCAPGAYYISLNSFQGCDSVVHLVFTELMAQAVINPASPPALTCTNGTVTLNASASTPAGVAYAWSGPMGFSSSNAMINVSQAGTYTVTVSDNTLSPACTSVASVTVTSNVIPPDLSVGGPAPQICQGEPFDLSTLAINDANNTNPTITFHSATPATPANQLASPIVSPNVTTTYYILGTNGSCSDETSVVLTVFNAPTASFTADAAICQTATATVTFTGSATPGATYNWNFAGGTVVSGSGAGPYEIAWATGGSYTIELTVTANGCTSSVFTQTVTVDSPLQAPAISCNTTTSSIEFSWGNVPGASSYTVNLLSGAAGTQSGNTYQVTGLNPGDQVQIEVVANGAGQCGNSSAQQTCTAENCPVVMVAINPVADICLSPATVPFNLSATVTGGLGTGSLSWSGSGITNSANGTFDPNQAAVGANTVTVIYQEGNCTYSESIQINVYAPPVASFTATPSICLSNSANIVFTGTAAPGAVFTWNFGGGNAMPGAGQGPHQVTWATPGLKTISLTVESTNGCLSNTFTADVQVDAPLATPVISCSSTTANIIFNWAAVPGATGYNITVQGQTLAVTNTSYEITGLAPGDTETITVEAYGNSLCGTSTATQTCQALDCPTVTITINPVADICLTSVSPTIPLTASVSNNSGAGILTWSGTGVSGNGIFDPKLAGAGSHTVTLLFEDGGCVYSESMDIHVFETPVSAFTLPASACVGEAVPVAYTGAITPGMLFDWDFGSGAATPIGPGQYEVVWPSGGNQAVSLLVTSGDGCVSAASNSDIFIETPLVAPAISCTPATTSIVFSWPDVPGATQYDITLIDGPAGVQAPNSYTVSGIPPGSGESVSIQLAVSGPGGCPPATVDATCTVLDCPTVVVDVQSVADICLDQNTSTLSLVATVTGGNGGIGQWSGPGITNNANGTFSPSVAGIGSHTVIYTYEEQSCVYADSTTIHIFQTPTASFTADSHICMEETATVAFTGTANSGAVFTWDFGGGMAAPGTGAGPHQVQWATPGNKVVSLMVNEGSCISQVFTQTIQVDAALAAPNIICSATTDSVLFFWENVPGGSSYDVAVINGPTGLSLSDTAYVFGNLNPGQPVAIQVTANGNTVCPAAVAQLACSAQPCPDVTIDILPIAPMCLTNAEPVTLLADVDGGSPGGVSVWTGPGVVGDVFDPAVAGVGTHTISFSYQLANCTYSAQTEIVLAPPPTADAGEDGHLSCWDSETTFRLGGQGNTVGPDIIYTWSADFGLFPGDQFLLHPEVSLPGTYTLLVIDLGLGCFSTDDVVVTSSQDIPKLEFDVKPISCKGKDDAQMIITSIEGGTAPYYFSLNSQPYVEDTTFPFLPPGDYNLAVLDGAGCENAFDFKVEDGQVLTADLTANLVGKNFVYAGEPLQLIALSSFQEKELDSIHWTNPELLDCSDCLDPVATLWETTTLTVTLQAGSCEASDDLTVYVKDEFPVYVPNAFSPNGDNINDIFTIYTGPQVVKIKNFMVFDRWGESVFKAENTAPGEPAMGWDGRHRGRLLGPAVFTWFAEIEFIDGSTKILEGDVTLML